MRQNRLHFTQTVFLRIAECFTGPALYIIYFPTSQLNTNEHKQDLEFINTIILYFF